MEIFSKGVKDYFLPVKWHILCMVLTVVFQYEGMLRFIGYNEIVARITQWLWMVFVALAAIKLVRERNFGIKNIITAGVFFSLIIHGLKAFVFRAFIWTYSGTAEEIWSKMLYKFFYGSSLVMAVTLAFGIFFIARKRGWLEK